MEKKRFSSAGSLGKATNHCHLFTFADLLMINTRVDVGRKRRVVTLLDLLAKGIKIHLIAVEGTLQSGHFVKETAEGPNVGLEVVAGFVDSFRRHVVRRADEGMGGGSFGGKESAQAKIAQFDDPLSRDKHVGRLDVSMHDASDQTEIKRVISTNESRLLYYNRSEVK